MRTPSDVQVWIGNASSSENITPAFGDVRLSINSTVVSLPILGTTEAKIVTLGFDARVTSSQAYQGEGIGSTADAIAIFDPDNNFGWCFNAALQADELLGIPATGSQVAVINLAPEWTLNGTLTRIYIVNKPAGSNTSVNVTLANTGDEAWSLSRLRSPRLTKTATATTANDSATVQTDLYAFGCHPYWT